MKLSHLLSSVLSSQHKYILFTLPNYENGTTKTKKDIIYSVSRNHCRKKQFKCMKNSSMIRLMTRSSCIRSLCEWQIHTSLLTDLQRFIVKEERRHYKVQDCTFYCIPDLFIGELHA